METRTGADPARACHDVLLAMAGRVPDRTLWRLRDWLGADAEGAGASGPGRAGLALRTALPRTLLRHRVGVTEAERALLRAAVLGWDGPGRLVDAVLHADGSADPSPAFAFDDHGPRPGWDTADLLLQATTPGAGREVLRAWRRVPGTRTEPARVVLVRTTEVRGAALAALAATVQRGLRAQGEGEPRVEVLAPDSPVTAYHEAALAGAETLSAGTAPAPPHPQRRAAGELVGHG